MRDYTYSTIMGGQSAGRLISQRPVEKGQIVYHTGGDGRPEIFKVDHVVNVCDLNPPHTTMREVRDEQVLILSNFPLGSLINSGTFSELCDTLTKKED